MLEAQLPEARTLKKLLEAIKELVTEANFECYEEGIILQTMDNSHVALVSVRLERAGFSKYRCDQRTRLGVNMNSIVKILKCAKDDDVCTLKVADDANILYLTYEAKNADRISDYKLRLMDIAPDTLNAPNTKYDVCVMMPSGEFARIIRDLSALGESVKIGVSRDGVSFSAEGEAGDGSVFLKQTESGQMRFKQEEGDEDKEEDSESDAKQRGAESFKLSKRSESPEDNDEYEGGVSIDMNQAVTLTFSLKYLVVFSKSASFSRKVQLSMSAAVPLRVTYEFTQGRIHYHLPPKTGED